MMHHSPEHHQSKFVPTIIKIGALAAALIGGYRQSVAGDAKRVMGIHAAADSNDKAPVSRVPMINRIDSPEAQERLIEHMNELKVVYASLLMTHNMLKLRQSMGDKSENTAAALEFVIEDMKKTFKKWTLLQGWLVIGGAVRG